MFNTMSRVSDLLIDVIISPTYNLITGVVASFSSYGNGIVLNPSAEGMSYSALTHEDIQFFSTLKFTWSLLIVFAVTLAGFLFLYGCYIFFFVPYNRIKRLGSIGYLNHEEGKLSKKDVANLVRKRRKLGNDLPPVFPNGWFRLLDSPQVNEGEVKEVIALGEHFAVYRSQNGKVSVLDAYCPHMGGNLAVGGVVKGDCLECPFHGWKFDRDGLCVNIPYSNKVPNFAKTKSWPCEEINGIIYVWYHCDGVGPEWEIPLIEEIENGKYHYRGRVEHHVNTHIQDLPENGSDQAHLSHLHLPSVTAGNNLNTQFSSWLNICDHKFKAECLGSTEEKPYVSNLTLKHHVEFFKRFKCLHLDFKIYQIGPGIVHLHFTSSFSKGVFVQSLTPHEPLHQVLTHNLYTDWTIPTWIGRIMLYMEAIQVDRDVMVWNNKTFRAQPKLVKEDKLISQYRRWFSQFYTENSPRLKMKEEDNIHW